MYIPLHRTVCVSLASYCVGQSIPMLETLDWRAVCGKTARTVRREGRARVLPYPYRVRCVYLRGTTSGFSSFTGLPAA